MNYLKGEIIHMEPGDLQRNAKVLKTDCSRATLQAIIRGKVKFTLHNYGLFVSKAF